MKRFLEKGILYLFVELQWLIEILIYCCNNYVKEALRTNNTCTLIHHQFNIKVLDFYRKFGILTQILLIIINFGFFGFQVEYIYAKFYYPAPYKTR